MFLSVVATCAGALQQLRLGGAFSYAASAFFPLRRMKDAVPPVARLFLRYWRHRAMSKADDTNLRESAAARPVRRLPTAFGHHCDTDIFTAIFTGDHRTFTFEVAFGAFILSRRSL